MGCCCCSVTQSCPSLCDPMNCSTPGFPVLHLIFQSLLKLRSIESVMPSNSLVLCCPLLLLPSIFPSIRVFSNELALHIRWPKYWSFSIILLMNLQGWFLFGLTDLISLPSKGFSRVFSNTTVQINSLVVSLLYSSILISIHDSWKNHSFDYIPLLGQSNVSDFNKLSRYVIAFLSRSKRLNFMAAVTICSDFEA